MSHFRVAIQSAPKRQGTTGTPSAWSAAGPVPTFSGIYDGARSRRHTFTVTTAGTIGTTAKIEVDWSDQIGTPSAWTGTSTSLPTFSGSYDGGATFLSLALRPRLFTFTVTAAGTIGVTAVITVGWTDGLGGSGNLNLGTGVGYTAGTVIDLANDIKVSFAAGTIASPGTFTLQASLGSTGRLHLGTDHNDYTAGDVVPVTSGVSVAFAAGAFVLASNFRVEAVAANRLTGAPVVVAGDAIPTDVRITGHDIGDIDIAGLSFDGRESRVQRSTTGTVRLVTDYLDDANMDKLRHLHSSRSPVCIGENFDETTIFLMHGGGLLPMIGQAASFSRASTATFQDGRTGLLRAVTNDTARVVAGKAGRAILQEKTSTNYLAQSSGKVGAPYWNVTGATITYDTTIKGPFEPSDPYWDPAFTDGVNRVYFSVSGDRIDTPDVTFGVAGPVAIAGSVWMRGRGEVTFELRTGAGAATAIQGSKVIALTPSWVRYELASSAGAGHTHADLRVVASEKGVCYVWGQQIEKTDQVTSLIQTNGAAVTRELDVMTFEGPIPPSEGTMSFWFFWPAPENINGLVYYIFRATGVTGAQEFRLEYNHNATAFILQYVSTTAFVFAGPNTPLTWKTWYHYTVTWKKGTPASSMDVAIYLNGQPLGSTNTTGWQPFFGTGFQFSPGMPIEEVRIDRSAKSAADVLEGYERLTSESWLHVHRAHAGRKYRIASMSPSWLHTSQPDKIVMELVLQEMDREDDSVVVPA